MASFIKKLRKINDILVATVLSVAMLGVLVTGVSEASRKKYNSQTGAKDFCVGFVNQSETVTNDKCDDFTVEDGMISNTGTADDPVFTLQSGVNNSTTTSGSSYTATSEDYSIQCDTSSANVTVNLPDAATVPGKHYEIINIGTNTCIIDPYTTQTIFAEGTFGLEYIYESVVITTSGDNWL